eukprot:6209961-Pleurochrysis_carterae.AAC.2
MPLLWPAGPRTSGTGRCRLLLLAWRCTPRRPLEHKHVVVVCNHLDDVRDQHRPSRRFASAAAELLPLTALIEFVHGHAPLLLRAQVQGELHRLEVL